MGNGGVLREIGIEYQDGVGQRSRACIPEAVIIGGAFAGVPLDYVRACLELGMAEDIDKLSYHPYRAVPDDDSALRQLKALRQLVDEHDPAIELWQGENGCPSRGSDGSVGALSDLEWDESRQAKWLIRRQREGGKDMLTELICRDVGGISLTPGSASSKASVRIWRQLPASVEVVVEFEGPGRPPVRARFRIR